MRRRRFLRGGLCGALVALAGCQATSDSGGRATIESREWRGSPTPAQARPAVQSSFELEASSDQPVEVTEVGESLGRALDRTVTLPPLACYRVKLLEPDRYAVQVRSPDRPRYEFQVAETAFDCNDHVADLRVSPTGLIEYVTSSTAVACAPPGEYPTREPGSNSTDASTAAE
jgi:hypothetical protein